MRFTFTFNISCFLCFILNLQSIDFLFRLIYMSLKKALIIFWIFLTIFSLSLNLNFYYQLNKNKFTKNNFFQAKVIKVIDGDTFDINGERVRLYEIDAPEYPQGCLGIDAKNRLTDLIDNQIIKYQEISKDNFGRILAYVYFKDIFINELIIEEGLAVYAKGKTITEKSLTLEKIQEKAKITKRGIWSNYCQTQKPGCLIKGNYRESDNTRLYHTPDCYNYEKITIRPNSSDRWFCTEKEAQKAGFTKSKDCPKK